MHELVGLDRVRSGFSLAGGVGSGRVRGAGPVDISAPTAGDKCCEP